MDDPRRVLDWGLDALLKAGADKAQCHLTRTEKHELNVMWGEIGLLRTTFETQLKLIAIKDGRKGSTTINKTDPESVQKAASEVLIIASASLPDEANDIPESQPCGKFAAGSESPDRDAMYHRLKEFLETVKARYPQIMLVETFLDFTREDTYVVNSNGVDLAASKGVYHCTPVFAAREDGRVSSFNGTSVAVRDLGRPLIDCGSTERLMQETIQQTRTLPVSGKFTGDVIIAPDCLGDMLAFLIDSIRDRALISGTSVYRNSLNEPVSSSSFSGGYPSENGDFSGVAKNSYLIEGGQVRYPITETMISGNLADCLKNIRSVSRERVDYGTAVFPWVAFSGVTISGR